MKRIAFIEHNLNAGGAERVTMSIIRALDLEKFEVHLVVVNKCGQLSDLIPKNVNVHELNVNHTRNAFFKTRSLFKEIKPEMVYSSMPNTTILTFFSSIEMKVRRIARYPSMPSLQKKEGHLRGWRYLLMKMLYRKIDKIIAQTDEMKAELQQFYKIKKQKIKVIMNPIDRKNIDKSVKDADDPFNNDMINVVASGRIGPEKGFDVLIDAFTKVVDVNDKFHLHVIGRDVDGNRLKLERKIEEYGISDNITFHGFQKNPYPYYKFCDLFVLSSRWEGLPNVVLECQYFGKPIVATRCIPVIERLIYDGKNGFIVNVGDYNKIAQAIIRYQSLVGERIYRNTITDFVEIFGEVS